MVNEKTTALLKSMNIPTRSELNALETRVKKLELKNNPENM
jgi:BMFP domain-containing protein YqiC